MGSMGPLGVYKLPNNVRIYIRRYTGLDVTYQRPYTGPKGATSLTATDLSKRFIECSCQEAADADACEHQDWAYGNPAFRELLYSSVKINEKQFDFTLANGWLAMPVFKHLPPAFFTVVPYNREGAIMSVDSDPAYRKLLWLPSSYHKYDRDKLSLLGKPKHVDFVSTATPAPAQILLLFKDWIAEQSMTPLNVVCLHPQHNSLGSGLVPVGSQSQKIYDDADVYGLLDRSWCYNCYVNGTVAVGGH